jgi:hypothetical protein
MKRHDWTALALIGMSAVCSLGLTSVLYLRCVDVEARESAILREAPVEIIWQQYTEPPRTSPAEVEESQTPRETTVEFHWQPFGERAIHQTSPGAYGLALRFPPGNKHSPTFWGSTRLVPTHRILPLRRELLAYPFGFYPAQMPTSKPSG